MSGTTLPISNARVTSIVRESGGPVDGYDSTAASNTDVWRGDASAIIKSKKVRIINGTTIDYVTEVTILIPALCAVEAGDTVTAIFRSQTRTYTVASYEELDGGYGSPTIRITAAL